MQKLINNRFLIGWILAFATTLFASPALASPLSSLSSLPARPLSDTTPLLSSPLTLSLRDPSGHPVTLHLNASEEMLVIVFLSPECPLCQNYTAVLNTLIELYKGKIALYGIIPGKSYSPLEIEKFQKDYNVRFKLIIDRRFQLSRLLRATTTPQAFLISRKNEILYTGLIDNWAASLGVQRSVVTKHYLSDAIDAALHHLPVNPLSTKPVGCLINTF